MRRSITEGEADLAHRGVDLRVDALGRLRPGAPSAVPAVGGAGEQRLAHLRPAGVVETDEEDVGHSETVYYIDGCRSSAGAEAEATRRGAVLRGARPPRRRGRTGRASGDHRQGSRRPGPV